MDLPSSAQAVRKYWWVVLLFIVFFTAGAALVTAREQPKYASSVTFFVSTPSNASGTNALQSVQFAQQRVNSYEGLLRSERLATIIAAQPGVGIPASDVQKEITASATANTVLLNAGVVDSSPDRSLAIARAIGNNFGKLVDQLDNRGRSSTVVLNVISGPQLSSAPVSPRKKLNIGLGLIIGLALGVAASILKEALDTSVRTAEKLRSLSGAPIVGVIRYDRTAKKAPLIVNDQARSVRAEAFRQLRTNLQFANVDEPPQVVVVTSSVAGEGKSTTASNLALVFAEAGRQVLLIEADMRRPRVTHYLGLDDSVGLSNVLAGQVSASEATQRWGESGVTVLPSGSIPPNPSELLGSRQMTSLMASLRAEYDIIVLDTPPLLPVTDAAVASANADGVLLVVRHGKTSRGEVASSIGSLVSVDAVVLGCVFNMVPPPRSRRKARYDSYGGVGGVQPFPVTADEALSGGGAHEAQPRSGARRPDPDRAEVSPR